MPSGKIKMEETGTASYKTMYVPVTFLKISYNFVNTDVIIVWIKKLNRSKI